APARRSSGNAMPDADAEARRRSLGGALERKAPLARAKRKRFDPVTAEIIRGAMESICDEVATRLSLTAAAPIFDQSNERNATILDGHGRLVALSARIPQLMLSSTL